MPNYSLYFTYGGECVLREQGEATTHEFSDILEAVTFISELDADHTATLTIYDPAGKMVFRDLLSERNSVKRPFIQISEWIFPEDLNDGELLGAGC